MDRPLKKAKVATRTAAAWQHYRNFLDTGALDELQELLQIVVMVDETIIMPGSILDCQTPFDFLAILVSMTHYQLASQSDSHETVLEHLQASLRYFPNNPATWSFGAQYAKMGQLVAPAVVAEWYLTAANAAADIRDEGLKALMNTNSLEMKEWIEVLVLDGLVGVEYRQDDIEIGSDDDENASDDEQVESVKSGEDEDNDDDDDDGYFSCSAVESTSRFMAAMILSTLGEHDRVVQELQHFDLKHRLMPNVWTGNGLIQNNSLVNVPCVFRGPVLPDALFQRMCHIFRPDATYWKESDYAHRGYYSYFMDLVDKPTNLMEQVIFEHLLPLAQQQTSQAIVGAEWWVHTRPIQANLGHNLHFDTDEVLLAKDGTISHPVVSSVLYLTGNNDTAGHTNNTISPAGSTIVLNQTPDSTTPATTCYSCPPRDNTFLVFPGAMLHGVLPCPVTQDPSSFTTRSPPSTNPCPTEVTWSIPSGSQNHHQENNCDNHRLTLMVGFWSKCVPDTMNNRTVYGPCGPLPMETSDWCRELTSIGDIGSRNSTSPRSEPLISISPVWETLVPRSEEDRPWLEIPRSLDHQFFVSDAARCFREAMMVPTT